MKTKFKIGIATVITIFSVISCESFIEVDVPQSQLTGQAVFEDASTATAALSNVYARLRAEGMVTGSAFGLSNFMGNYADELTFYGSNTVLQSINNHTIVPSNSYVATLWNSSYGQIYALNAIIEGVANSNNINTENKNKLLGEALFLRAYIHFYLVNCFGEIPYIKTTNYIQNTTISRNTISEINENILNDLTDAEALLANNYPTTERVRANKFVAKAMLARVHLYLENWAQAEDYATAVINNTSYGWDLNIQNVFLRNNPGIIWALHPGIAGLNTLDARTFIFSSGPPIKQALS
ncbi:MAG: RagB/SusD family nutrient uptake outer membrane protein, partial [Flavobacterium sp.]|nr:RagB/SusD family nutrient uptake outer membrane protein [Flavobacterium sp.]